MKDAEWRHQDVQRLEQLLVERWLYRGALLAIMLVAAIASTYLGIQGVTTVLHRVTLGALLALALAAGGVAFAMRQADLRIHRELRRRSRPHSPPAGAAGGGSP